MTSNYKYTRNWENQQKKELNSSNAIEKTRLLFCFDKNY